MIAGFALCGTVASRTTRSGAGVVDEWARPDFWTVMAEAYLEHGLVSDAFHCYDTSIEEGSANSFIFHSFANLLLASRNEAAAFYRTDVERVIDQAFTLYDRALELNPTSYDLAADCAMSYYSILPRRPEQAIRAWNKALNLAQTTEQRDEALVHLSRNQVMAGQYRAAYETLGNLRSPDLAIVGPLKQRIESCL
jgi:tetratricopeptide (TPR) repeat protein